MKMTVLITMVLALSAAGLHGAERVDEKKVYSEAEAMKIGWPQLAGPFGTFVSPTLSTPLVADLSHARVLWESECRDLGRAKGGSQAYRSVDQFTAEAMAKMGSHPGSWAGPIVADGMVFCASWRPVGQIDFKGAKVRLDAEDIVVAMDALTGKTKWLAAEPGGILRGGGKRQGFQVGPVYHDGVVYSVGSTARVFAYEAKTGKKLWESDAHPMRATMKKKREDALAAAAAGKWSYDLNPNWCSSLAFIGDTLVVPSETGGLVGIDPATGQKKWAVAGVIAKWATPSAWQHDGSEYVLCANEKGELRLIEPSAGKELWKLGGLGQTWFTLAPGKTHVLVNIVADSGKARGADRVPGRLGAVELSLTGGEKAWDVGDGKNHSMPVWMDSGARVRPMYRDGRFLVPNCWQGKGQKSEVTETDDGAPKPAQPAATTAASKPADPSDDNGGAALLVEESTGKTLAELKPANAWNDQLSGLTYWCGDRIISRADSFHGPTHGGRHPWLHWTLANNQITRGAGSMDLSSFTNAYEVPMEAPLVAGLLFERTEKGTIVCYDLRAK